MLIKLGANLEARSKNDLTALLTAVARDKPKLVELLLENGAKLDLETKNILAK
jgi:ankyrin repeat protein